MIRPALPKRLFGIAGWSGSGKTSLIARLIPCLVRRGLRVSTIKHAHHGFDIDVPGKDSHTHRLAGATEVLVSSGRRWALMHELRDASEPELRELLALLGPADLVLVEGFKRDAYPKLEVHRPSLGKSLLQPDDPTIVGIAAETMFSAPVPVMGLHETSVLADFVLDHATAIDYAPAPR